MSDPTPTIESEPQAATTDKVAAAASSAAEAPSTEAKPAETARAPRATARGKAATAARAPKSEAKAAAEPQPEPAAEPEVEAVVEAAEATEPVADPVVEAAPVAAEAPATEAIAEPAAAKAVEPVAAKPAVDLFALPAAEVVQEELSSAADAVIDSVTVSQQQALETLETARVTMFESVARVQMRIAGFVSERIRQEVQAQQELLRCKSLEEVRDVQTRFLRTAVTQYSEEASELLRIGGKAMTRSVERVD